MMSMLTSLGGPAEPCPPPDKEERPTRPRSAKPDPAHVSSTTVASRVRQMVTSGTHGDEPYPKARYPANFTLEPTGALRQATRAYEVRQAMTHTKEQRDWISIHQLKPWK